MHFPSAHHQRRCIVVVAHGLNCRPQSMGFLIQFLCNEGAEVFLVTFCGHQNNSEQLRHVKYDQWYQDFMAAYQPASEKARALGIPLFFAGFSLGGLVGQYAQCRDRGAVQFDKQILLAPAVALSKLAHLIRLSFVLPENQMLPGFTPEVYSAGNRMPVKAYKMLFYMKNYLKQEAFKYLQAPALVFIDPKDELVSYDKLQQYKQRYDLKNYTVLPLASDKRTAYVKFYHLILDEASLGSENWQWMRATMYTFLFGN